MRSLGNPQNQAAKGGGLSCPFVRSGQSASFHDRPDFSADAIKHHFRWFGRRGGLCCTNGERDSLFESSGVATVHEQLVRYEVQDQELAFVQHGAEAARFAINLV